MEQEHGRELKEVWNRAQGNVGLDRGIHSRVAEGDGAQQGLSESVWPHAGFVSLPRL